MEGNLKKEIPKAVQYLENSQVIEAFKALEPFIEKDFVDSEFEFQKILGKTLFLMRRYKEATEHLFKAIESLGSNLYKNEKEFFEIYFKTLEYLEKYELILEDFDKYDVLINFPNEKVFLKIKVNALCYSEKYEDAKEILEKNFSDDQEGFSTYITSKISFLKGDYEESNSSLITLSKEQRNLDVYLLKAKIDEKLMLPDKDIIKDYEKCIQQNKKYIPAYIEIIKIFLNNALEKNAVECINKAEENIDPKYQKPYQALFLLHKIEVLCKVKRRAEANKILIEVSSYLRDEKIRKTYSVPQEIEIYSKYFEIYHLCKYLYSENLFVDKTKKIGKGGFGVVYEGTLGKEVKKEVAVKEFYFKVELYEKEETTYKNLRVIFEEASAMELLSGNEYMLEMEAIFFEDNRSHLMLVSPRMIGGNLSALLKENKPIPIKTRIEILLQIAKGLRYMHSLNPPFVHFDLKSSNILLEKPYSEKDIKIRLCDFGMARNDGRPPNGFTPSYAAPEVLIGSKCDTKSDIFSFGVLMWECFSRTIPFRGRPAQNIMDCIKQGERLNKDDCDKKTPNTLLNLMDDCWLEDKEERPNIDRVISVLKKAK